MTMLTIMPALAAVGLTTWPLWRNKRLSGKLDITTPIFMLVAAVTILASCTDNDDLIPITPDNIEKVIPSESLTFVNKNNYTSLYTFNYPSVNIEGEEVVISPAPHQVLPFQEGYGGALRQLSGICPSTCKHRRRPYQR